MDLPYDTLPNWRSTVILVRGCLSRLTKSVWRTSYRAPNYFSDGRWNCYVEYKGVRLDCGYRVDLLVDGKLVVELKSVEQLLPIPKPKS